MAKAVPLPNNTTSCRVALIFQGGHQGESLHHKQNASVGNEPDYVPNRRPELSRPAGAVGLLQAALPGHDAIAETSQEDF